jgi:glycosyltransferase involved in cell wall biosynthesis
MYPGTLSWHQGLDLAITAFAKVSSSMPNAQLHFYGRGSEEESLKNLAKSLSMTDVIFFNGLLPLHEVAVKMASCQLGIIPKRADDFGNEAFSTKIFEFMTLGVPVLISSTKIDRYYFDESVVTFFTSGNIDELAKQMVFLYANEQVRINQAQRAEKFIQAYSWDSKKHEYFALIDALIN